MSLSSPLETFLGPPTVTTLGACCFILCLNSGFLKIDIVGFGSRSALREDSEGSVK